MCVFPINSSACQGLRGAHGETIESFCRVYSVRRQILENVYRSRYDSRVGELLQLRELTVELPTAAGRVKPVNGVSLGIPPGESLGLIGESGSGKTMLSLALMGLLPPGARVSGEARLASRHERKAADGADRSRMALRSWTRNRHDLSATHDLAESRDARRPANRGSHPGARACHRQGSARPSFARRDRIRLAAGARSPRPAISPSTLRRPPPARHDPDGAGSIAKNCSSPTSPQPRSRIACLSWRRPNVRPDSTPRTYPA